MSRLLISLLLSLVTGISAVAADPDATARFLAGMPVRGTAMERASLDPAWAAHAAAFDRAWGGLEQRQLSRIEQWAPQFLGPAHGTRGPMFYFFSGPDFLYANAFFPDASTYLLCGIEPVGPLPDLASIPPGAIPGALANLRKSLDSVLSWSFFITKNMKVDLTQQQLNGTIPVLYVFLARAGCRIESAELVALASDGGFTTVGKGIPGVKIVFHGASGRRQTLYYFSSDLADGGIRSSPGFVRFCDQQGRGVSLLKAASYLLHEDGFSRARDFLLKQSSLIVQDDSGIPIRFFRDWRMRYCGRYLGPIELFKQHFQPELAHVFAATVPVPLDFGFGYQWQPSRSLLLVATPR